MNIALRKYQSRDLPFLKKMLYEAVYWRGGPDTPSFEESLALPGMKKALNGMGSRSGDAALIACLDEKTPVGAAWYRYWKEEDALRGYISDDIPVLAIAVGEPFRNRGIGAMLIDGLIDLARDRSVPRISLCASKDNYALKLYRAKGFTEYEDLGHSFNMCCRTD